MAHTRYTPGTSSRTDSEVQPQQNMLPTNLEMIVFLSDNRDLWDFTSFFCYEDTDGQSSE
ncbi:hypothetical protein PHPALM_31921 [Phytophthora palmivora]|uniref:Uncharacterized protein n=1 Tax=Phytophthora palmivora TaxID=4796 RepID=A0A2P4X1C9_9STRA|nr:hypothetical protein PHPALM_31921 [Phytophthora palmivora]